MGEKGQKKLTVRAAETTRHHLNLCLAREELRGSTMLDVNVERTMENCGGDGGLGIHGRVAGGGRRGRKREERI
jgi:hypothetical protein